MNRRHMYDDTVTHLAGILILPPGIFRELDDEVCVVEVTVHAYQIHDRRTHLL
jgi:hypothetical protein